MEQQIDVSFSLSLSLLFFLSNTKTKNHKNRPSSHPFRKPNLPSLSLGHSVPLQSSCHFVGVCLTYLCGGTAFTLNRERPCPQHSVGAPTCLLWGPVGPPSVCLWGFERGWRRPCWGRAGSSFPHPGGRAVPAHLVQTPAGSVTLHGTHSLARGAGLASTPIHALGRRHLAGHNHSGSPA